MSLPATFGGVAKYVTEVLNREGEIVHFISDMWLTPSTMDCKRQRRNTADINYQIFGASLFLVLKLH